MYNFKNPFQQRAGGQFQVEEEHLYKKIVPVTVQNLIENAIKHNIVDEDSPLIIEVFVSDDYLIVRNNLQKKKFVETSNRKGIVNLKSFYGYLSDRKFSLRKMNSITPLKFHCYDKSRYSWRRGIDRPWAGKQSFRQLLMTWRSFRYCRAWNGQNGLQNAEPDLLFMDIQLSDGVSFENFEHFKLSCPVIFTTATMIMPFGLLKSMASIIWLKPIDMEELRLALDRYRQRQQEHLLRPTMWKTCSRHCNNRKYWTGFQRKIHCERTQQLVPVSTQDIAMFQRENLNYLYTFSGDRYLVDNTTLDEVEELLDQKYFTGQTGGLSWI